MNGETQWIALLLASLVRPFVLVAAAGLVLRVFRVRHPASRHAVWSVVLFAMLLLPIVSVIAPHWRLPASPRMEEPPAPISPVFLAPEPLQTISLPSQPVPPKTSLSTHTAWFYVVRFYLAGLFAMLLYRAVGWIMLRRVIARSTPIKGRALRESADVIAPVAVGVLRPAVILPIGWRDWNAETRRAVLAHEFAHIRRNDTLISALARFTKSVLWFHPLAWWISRRVAELAELACDAVALESLRDPGKYSRILLDFASGVNRAGYRVALPGSAMAASSSGMGRRIDQVFELADGSARKLARPGALLALIGLPVMCLAATVGLGDSNKPLQLPPIVLPKNPELRVIAQQKAPPQSAAQFAPVPPPKWEVASIRFCDKDGGGGRRGGGPTIISPGRMIQDCQSLEGLITAAYLIYANGRMNIGAVTNTPIQGGPSWIRSDRFTINAKAEGTPSREVMQGPMLQSLLEDRFKLKIRRETREVPVYLLTAAKGDLKLPPFKPGSCIPLDLTQVPPPPLSPGGKRCAALGSSRGPNYTVNVEGISIGQFAKTYLRSASDRPLIDKTGIVGLFNFHVQMDCSLGVCSAVAGPSDDPAFPSIFAAMEQLGLKLEKARGPGEFLVIDSAEPPSEN